MRFSANLGFLWTERALPEAVFAAKRAGFDAVECHWPYETPAEQLKSALLETGLPILGINTPRGDLAKGDFGLAALPEREKEARAAIGQAVEYAVAVGAQNIHVMAGNASGEYAHETFLKNLEFACEQAKHHGITCLVEPLNRHDAPHYFLRSTDQARKILGDLARPNLKLMFDCYHVARNEGDVTTRFRDLLPLIGHIQIASVPSRTAPDSGELHYPTVLRAIAASGWDMPVGAEYRPDGDTEASLAWLEDFRLI